MQRNYFQTSQHRRLKQHVHKAGIQLRRLWLLLLLHFQQSGRQEAVLKDLPNMSRSLRVNNVILIRQELKLP